MKYLLPLINSNEYSNLGNVNLKFQTNKKFIEEMENKKYEIKNASSERSKKHKKIINYSQTSIESLPSIQNNRSLTLNINNNPSGMIYENESK